MKVPQPNGGGVRASHLGRDDRAELHDPLLERDFLGSCLIYPELILPSQVTDSDFYSNANRTIFAAMLRLVADGERVDTLTVRGALTDANKLEAIGGSSYLDSLTDGIPSREPPVQRLRLLARKRRVHDAARLVVSKVGDDELPRYFTMLDAARADLLAVESPAVALPLLAQCVPMIRQIGPRLPLGLPTIDAATRGGIPMGKVLFLVGAPGASKTNLATWLADGWERAGCAILFMAADEARESIITRFGQLDGFDRDALENGDDDGRRNAFQRNAAGRMIAVIDPCDDRITLEAAERTLIELAATRPRVLVVDSLQTVPCEAANAYETKREQIEAKVEVIKAIAKRGAIVLCVSEMARAGYRTGKSDSDISALGAGAESRAIEYAASLLLGLKPVRGERGLIDVEVAKNRIGPDKPEIRLSLNFDSLMFREIERPVDDEADREVAKFSKLRARIIAVLAREHTHRTATLVVRSAGAQKRAGMACFRELLEEGVIAKVDGCFRLNPGTPT